MTFYTLETDKYQKATINTIPPEAWLIAGQGENSEIQELYNGVSWMYRCVDIRANALAGMPWELQRRGEAILTNEDDIPANMEWMKKFPDMLRKTEAAVTLRGKAYWFKERNRVRTVDTRWLLPDSINPIYKKEGDGRADVEVGTLLAFERKVGLKTVELDVEDVIYFWPADYAVEQGPAKNYPGAAAMSGASVLNSMSEFKTGYFERGMIKATILTMLTEFSPAGLPVTIREDEIDRVKEFWRRAIQGIKNAFSTHVLRGQYKPIVIGEGLNDLENKPLTDSEREDIATAFGVPQSKITANAANFATKRSDDRTFYEDAMIPEADWIASVLNAQLFEPMGLMFVFKPEKLSVMQEDEQERAASLASLVNSGVPLLMAMDILGYTLTDEQRAELEQEMAEKKERSQQIQENIANSPDNEDDNDEERKEELKRFGRWLAKDPLRNPWDFKSGVISVYDRVSKAAEMGFEPDYKTADDELYEQFQDAMVRLEAAVPGMNGSINEQGQ